MDWVFGDNPVIDETTLLSKVPENLRSAYAPIPDGDNKGKFGIPQANLPFTTAIDGFSKSLRTARTERDELRTGRESLLAPWTALGKTPDEVKARIESLERSVAERGKVDVDALRAEAQQAAAGQLKEKDAEIARKDSALVRYLVKSEAISALREHKGSEALLMPHIERQCKVVRGEGDDYIVHVVDEKGNARGDGQGGFMTVRQLVESLKKDAQFGVAFESEKKGGGAGSRVVSQPTGAVVQQANQTGMHGVSRIAAGLAKRR